MTSPDDKATVRLSVSALKERASDIDALTRLLAYNGIEVAPIAGDIAILHNILIELRWESAVIKEALSNVTFIKAAAQKTIDILALDILSPAPGTTGGTAPQDKLLQLIRQLRASSPRSFRAIRSGLFTDVFGQLAEIRVDENPTSEARWKGVYDTLELLVTVTKLTDDK